MPRLSDVDPKNKAATKEFINTRWEELKNAPLQVGKYFLDFKTEDMNRMQNILSQWEGLNLEGDKIEWRFADNSTKLFNRTQFADLIWKAREAHTKRELVLFEEAQQLKRVPDITERQVVNWRR